MMSSHPMIRLIAFLMLSSSVSFAADEKTVREEFQVRAQVQDIVALSAFSGTVIPIGVDPHFALTVRVDSVVPPLANFTNGAAITFAIHSPSRLFTGENVKGKTYEFTLCRETASAKTNYSSLDVRRAP
jgi:hypothetical protein